MARKRVEATKLKSWAEVDETLRLIAENERSIVKIESKMNEEREEIVAKAEEKAKPFKEQIAVFEIQIKEFVESSRDDLGDKKTKELNFGKTGFRKSTKVTLPSAANKLLDIIKKLKAFGMTDCIVQPPEKIDKEALKKYPANDIIKVGAGLKVDDVFWYEVNEETLADLG